MKTNNLINLLNVLAWVVCIGLLIKAGAILISFVVSLYQDQAAKDLYDGLNLFAVKQHSVIHYSFLVAYQVLILLFQAHIALLLTKLFSGISSTQPFTPETVKHLEKIGLSMILLWAVTITNNIHAKILEATSELMVPTIPTNFIALAGITYLLAHVFKRGVEIQTENELTV